MEKRYLKESSIVLFTISIYLLIDEIIRWAICYNYMIFKPEGDDKDSDYFHIVNLDTKAEYLIRDFMHDTSCNTNHNIYIY